ncbi:carbohydrate ABC transporter permease [Paenibacillus sp. P25]|nr:carbohydrate ABC transporter permease [Paenibacillus sp. P25]
MERLWKYHPLYGYRYGGQSGHDDPCGLSAVQAGPARAGRHYVFCHADDVFQRGLIPTYLLVKSLGMVNTMWALIIPGAIATYNLIVMRTYFQSSIPWEIQEAAHIDGCSNWKLLTHVILPLSKPILAVMILFYAVGHWNSYFNALIYIRSKEMYPLQLVLRELLMVTQADAVDSNVGMESKILLAESVKYVVIIISSLPVLVMYPFVQRHFVKGVMIGSLKG